ncbi:MAG: hypothetical protein NXY57DRAFT_969888 [Lentinula lateritia]|nr:MAG: hypothetical protein NXY57DRAFT_969888 [Lentinula lateritia]
MFRFPTGVRVLVIREGFPRQLKRGRPRFTGGTADLAQPEVPGKVRTMKGVGEEFEGFEVSTLISLESSMSAHCEFFSVNLGLRRPSAIFQSSTPIAVMADPRMKGYHSYS